MNELEKTRGVTARTRNLRLTAIRSFFRFAAYEMPTHSAQIQRVLAMPAKRFDRKLIDFLTRPEVDALLDAPDKSTWTGRRDHALLLTTLQTGLRLSEATGLQASGRDVRRQALTSTSSARGASSAPSRFASRSPTSSKHGSMNQLPPRTTSSSRASAAAG